MTMLSLPVAAAVAVLILATVSSVSMLARGDQIDRAARPLTAGMVIASLIIGSSIVLTAGSGPRIWGLPSVGLFGFIGTAIVGIWVLISAWRSGRKK